MDPYQSCPCGSGKSFKWCCQSYYHLVEKARKQHQDGQHETALRTIKQLVDQNPGSAPVLGYQAELFYTSGKAEEADETIQKAFAINPEFPFGHWLRAIIRKDEGEIKGALIEFRKAAELYDPKANDVLAEINSAIFDIEMRLNRPIAARGALDRAIHADPAAEALRNAHHAVFGPESRLPLGARKAYTFRTADAGRLERWKATLPATPHGRLSEAQSAFEKLTGEDPGDAAAWFNLGLVRAWLGDEPRAIEALQASIDRDDDAERLTEASALIEVLRCAAGMEEQADYHEHRIFFQFQVPQPLVQLLEEWQRNQRLYGAQSDQSTGAFSAVVLEEAPRFGDGIGAPVAKMAAYLLVLRNIVRLWSPVKEAVEKLADHMKQVLGTSVSPPMQDVGFCGFSDISVEATLVPTREVQITEITGRLQEHAKNFFEEIWMQRPLKALSGLSPADAAGRPDQRKRLPGVVKFVEECFIASSIRVQDGDKVRIYVVYDFEQLRRKLGLAGGPAPEGAAPAPRIEALSAAELAALTSQELGDAELDEAFRASLKLDARDLASRFARDLIQRSASGAWPDPYPYFNHLIQTAQADNDPATVIALLDQAEQADLATNEGRRRNDYSLRRGQTLARRGDVDGAYQTFQDLLGRDPNELKFYGPATEAMLGQKKGQWAVQFAEQGLARARAQNNRDSEQYLMELLAAAQKLT